MEKRTRASNNQTQTSVYFLGRQFYALSFLTCLTCLLSFFLFNFLVQSSVPVPPNLTLMESDMLRYFTICLLFSDSCCDWLSLNCAKIDQYCIIFNWFPMNFDFSILCLYSPYGFFSCGWSKPIKSHFEILYIIFLKKSKTA